MTIAEARRILAQRPEFGARPDKKVHQAAQDVLDAWESYKRHKQRGDDFARFVCVGLERKYPSFRRETE